MIHMIYMAAGNSRRFKGNKLLTEINGEPLYRHGLKMLQEVADSQNSRREDSGEQENDKSELTNHCLDLTVVTQYREILDDCEAQGISAVYSPESIDGASYTIRNGIKHLAEDGRLQQDDYLMFAVADQPFLTRESVQKLIEAVWTPKKDSIAEDCTFRHIYSLSWNGVPGNPKLFHASHVKELMLLTGDEGGRSLVKKYGMVKIEACSAEELRDIDEREDMD